MTIKKIKLKPSCRGFTLAELAIIIVIIGIFAVLASSRTDIGIGKIRQRIAIDQITSDIDLVRSMAFASNDTITIAFSSDSKSYTVYVGSDDSRQVLSSFPNSQSGTIVLDNNVNISLVNFDGMSELQFLPMGDVKSGGIIDLNNNRITVNNITGKWTLGK
mgnify:FL=1